MGMIRVSEEVEKQLKEIADGRSMSATVEMLIKGAGNTADNMFSLTKEFMGHIDEKFDELKSLIEDTTVDRVDNGGPRSSRSSYQSNVKVYVPWETARELLYEFLPEDAPEFIGNASEAIRQADNEFPVFIQDDKLWTEDFYGTKSPILNITPRVTQFLKEANVAEH